MQFETLSGSYILFEKQLNAIINQFNVFNNLIKQDFLFLSVNVR